MAGALIVSIVVSFLFGAPMQHFIHLLWPEFTASWPTDFRFFVYLFFAVMASSIIRGKKSERFSEIQTLFLGLVRFGSCCLGIYASNALGIWPL